MSFDEAKPILDPHPQPLPGVLVTIAKINLHNPPLPPNKKLRLREDKSVRRAGSTWKSRQLISKFVEVEEDIMISSEGH